MRKNPTPSNVVIRVHEQRDGGEETYSLTVAIASVTIDEIGKGFNRMKAEAYLLIDLMKDTGDIICGNYCNDCNYYYCKYGDGG